MTDQEKITALRDALTEVLKRSMESNIAHIAKNALAMTAEASEGATDERAQFEAWYAPRHDAVDFLQRDDGQYDDWDIALQWNAWQARAKLEGSDK